MAMPTIIQLVVTATDSVFFSIGKQLFKGGIPFQRQNQENVGIVGLQSLGSTLRGYSVEM